MVTRGSRKRPVPKLPTADQVDVTGMRREIDYKRLTERVDQIADHLNDHGKRIAETEASAAHWAGLSQRVKTLEDKPDPVVVDSDGEVVPVPVMTIAMAFLIHDLAVGAAIFGAYWVARGYGWHLPVGWL